MRPPVHPQLPCTCIGCSARRIKLLYFCKVHEDKDTTSNTVANRFHLFSVAGPNYFEVDVDITSNTVANSVTSLVVGAITSLVVDLAPLVEGQVRAPLCPAWRVARGLSAKGVRQQ